jgi:serine/threonine-protein kinase
MMERNAPSFHLPSRDRMSRADERMLIPDDDATAVASSTLLYLPAARYLNRYVIEQTLGAGGMGEVYRARDMRLERTVAIKMLPRASAGDFSTRRRFLNEARTASALNHPNIVALYDICTDEDIDFLVMEFVDGRTLRNLVQREVLSFERLALLGSQVAMALGAAHAAGIIHRDIKSANIMVNNAGQAKVLDFGLAKATHGEVDAQLTMAGQVLGTAAYMSPEQTRGEELDHRSDLFSFGCVLYEAATGHLPFRAASLLGLMHEIATNDPEPPSVYRPELPPEFVRLVMRCLAKDRADRPDSAVELATELRSLTFPQRSPLQVKSQRTSLVVLPLRMRGPAADQFLSVSLAEALIHRLSSTGKLNVRPVAAVLRYAASEVEWLRVARELNVDLVVEGTVQIMGGKIRVLIQVHRANDAETIASLKQDGHSEDLFGLQDRLADAVSEVFVPAQKTGTEPRMPPTKNADAFELYLRAVDRQVHVDRYEMASAIELLTRATELDPRFADAWGLLAQACAQMGAHLDPDPKWFEMGERAIARTLELDPVRCTALSARGTILWSPARKFQNRAALRALNAAIKIDPTRPTARHQRTAILWHLGFVEAAEHDADELQTTNLTLSTMHRGAIALVRGDYEASMEHYSRAMDLEPNGVLNHLLSPVAVLYAGRLDEASAAIEKARARFPAESFGLGMQAILAGISGDVRRAEILADEAGRSTYSLTHTHHTWHSCAAAYAVSGLPDKALTELERCAGMGLPNYRLFESDPYLKHLRGDARFSELMTRLRREHDSIREEFGLES